MARKILLADDSVTAQNMGRKILADAGYEVITVNNGSAALKRISEHRPDLIVLDVYMPGYSGLEVCQRLKEVAETSRIPVLLTVGKLEPFKPEEAKRVRADGFIVKPFEASELLSALSKLEDKVVPRAESSKPGRFARATAAIEESRYDKTMATEEDAGWKNRISFPSKKKKEKVVETDADDPAIYNPVNKDLKTVVEHKPSETAQPVQEMVVQKPEQKEEEPVNLGALAPEGLPKDVTPEEIAALAAAAAQIKGVVEEKKPEAPISEKKKPEEKQPVAEAVAEIPVAAPVEAEAPKVEAKEAAPATFAEQEAPKKADSESEVPASPGDVMAAIARIEKESAQVSSSENGSGSPSVPEKSEEPVTMAVAAPAYSGPAVSRWTAQAVALAPEEASISLEQEMQKAFAAAASAESSSTTVVAVGEPAVAEPTPAVYLAPEPAPAPAPVVEAPAPTEATVLTEVPVAEVSAPAAAETVSETRSAVSEIATEATAAIDAAVKELEAVAASYVAPAPVEEVKAEPAVETASAPAEQDPAQEETEAPEAKSVAAPGEAVAPVEEAKAEVAEAPAPEAAPVDEPKEDLSSKEDLSKDSSKEGQPQEEIKSVAAVAEVPAAVPVSEAVEEEESDKEASAEPAAAKPRSYLAGGRDDMAKRESETAQAWASWRKIRETGDSKNQAESKESEAAMAVAAGAESKPEDVTALDSDPEISSLVDSVLADMRPKIVEEIAKKLGKKK